MKFVCVWVGKEKRSKFKEFGNVWDRELIGGVKMGV